MDVIDFFGKNADKYAKSQSHAKGEDLGLLLSKLPLDANMSALDIAAGTGFTALEVARKVRFITAFDKTIEMLEEARNLFEREKVENVLFVTGDVGNLPFLDHSFDVITCRRAAHHFHNKMLFLSEANRVLKSGGYLGLVDMTSPAGDDMDLFNNLERLRDHSHASAGTSGFWTRSVEGMGWKIISFEACPERIPFEKWLYPVTMESSEGKDCIEYLESKKEQFKKLIDYDGKSFVKTRIIMVAQKV
ncbi:MAG: class I SAM-dependent methyltransferase [Thermoplasmataceae archaeon]